jgi:thymidylate kinase
MKPTITIVLHGRGYPKEGKDSYEKDSDLQREVRRLYKEWALTHKDECILIDVNDRTPQEIHELIIGALELRGLI